MLTLLNQWWLTLCAPEKEQILVYVCPQSTKISDQSIFGTHKMRYSQIPNFLENLEVPENEKKILLESLTEADNILARNYLYGIQWRLAQWELLNIVFGSEDTDLLVLDVTKKVCGDTL